MVLIYILEFTNLYIYLIYIKIMKKIPFIQTNKITVDNIDGYFERQVTKFGTGAKVDVLKEHLGKKVIVLVLKERA